MDAILAKFREDLELRGFARNSRDHYEGVYGFYTSWLEGRGRDLEETDESDVRGYALHMIRERQYAPATVNNYLAAVVFLYEATLGRPLNHSQIPYMKIPKRLPKVFSREVRCTLIFDRGITGWAHPIPLQLPNNTIPIRRFTWQ